jgi:hypothetical protein
VTDIRVRSQPESQAGGARMHRSWFLICGVALVSSLVSLTVYIGHVPNFFMGDDFELIGDALAGTSVLEPVSAHLRPMIRLHFMLYRWIPSPVFFGAFSILLHALASGAVFLALRATHGRILAIPAALLFFSCFLANEAVFWASSAAVVYCMIFSCLALAAFARGRLVAAYVWLIPAAMSYELWLVVPLLFLFHYRHLKELIVPYVMAAAWLGLHLFAIGIEGASAYGGFSIADLPVRFAIYAYRFLSPLAGSPSLGASLALLLLLVALLAVPRYRYAAVLYVAAALIFSLSAHVSSRFYYFPALALILILVTGLQSQRRTLRVVASVMAVYLAVASPWINGLDGEDYLRKAALHRELYEAFASRIDSLADGERAVIVNRLGPQRLASLRHERVGRPKLVFVRGPAMAGMIYPDDAVRMALWLREERPERSACSGSTIEVGREGAVRSTYCFRVTPL